ncbi:MAG: thiolase family protein [Mangrovicoccus sp.]|nr:thiolase family protein [Mangrovicoccus sp.]
MTGAVVLAACRAPVCPSGGGFAHLSLEEIAGPVIADLLTRADIAPEAVEELILGNGLGAGGNPARRVALAAQLPERVAGLSIDRQCASGLDALRLGAAMIISGQAKLVIAGGVENHSQRPIRQHRASGTPYEQAPFTPWPDRDPDMITAAADLAARQGLSREEADAYAIASHGKALAAHARLRGEITPIAGITADPFTRALRPALAARARALSGGITPANMAVAADGAAFCLLASADMARKDSVAILASASLGADPQIPPLAALPAIEAVLAQSGLRPDDLAAAEVMEAFAVQALATIQAAGLDPKIVNPAGGALARGHPIGASGAIGAVRAAHEAQARQGPVLTTIPAAGGIGSAMIFAPL